MSDDELNWQKNVKPIECGKVILKVDHKIDIKPMVNRDIFNLQLNTSLSFCLDYNTKSRVKYLISDKLDLHGYSIEGAYCKLIDFIMKSYQAGNRCLLIVTGHGNVEGKTDTIKNNLHKWLNDTKIQHMILYHQQATKKHGGKGAFYVLLRKLRLYGQK